MQSQNTCTHIRMLLATMLSVFVAATLPLSAQEAYRQPIYYGIEISDVLCGYAEFDLQRRHEDGRDILAIREHVFALLTALGSEFDSRQTITYDVDLATGNFLRHRNEVEQGDMRMGGEYVIDGDVAHLTAFGEETPRSITLPPDVVLSNTIYFPHLKKAFADEGRDTLRFETLQVRDGVVQSVVATRLPDREITFGDTTYRAFGVEEFSESLGLRVRMWIDPESAMLQRAEIMNRTVFLADADVVKRIQVADLNDGLLVKTDTRIADIQGITGMKVRARLEPVGVRLSHAGLNGPGQSFEGVVEENRVEGVFEIAHVRYTGENAPPFPPGFADDPALQPYLEASALVEVGDPVLAKEARSITADARDSWEAATRLSTWVSRHIAYAIPGGGSARRTYDIRAGECGAHSLLLTAFCRSVGIPARVVWGCMYTPNLGGSFGQHAWNEIYMGEGGWIPVDATAMEVDFVDSGHLRIGEMESTVIALNAKDLEILDYDLGEGMATEERKDVLAEYCGGYTSEAVGGKVFQVSEQNGKLALHIPDRMTLMFNDADEHGIWPCQLSPALTLEFLRDEADRVQALALMEENRMPRVPGDTDPPEDIPDALRPMLGTFELTALKAQFGIIYTDGRLTLKEPRGATHVLHEIPGTVQYESEDGARRVRFERDAAGDVVAMIATHRTVLNRQ